MKAEQMFEKLWKKTQRLMDGTDKRRYEKKRADGYDEILVDKRGFWYSSHDEDGNAIYSVYIKEDLLEVIQQQIKELRG